MCVCVIQGSFGVVTTIHFPLVPFNFPSSPPSLGEDEWHDAVSEVRHICQTVYSATQDSRRTQGGEQWGERSDSARSLVVAPTGIRSLYGNTTNIFIIFEEFLRLGLTCRGF